MSGGGTIYALATPPGRGGVAVIRISGEDAAASLERLSGAAVPPPRRAVLRSLTGGDDRGRPELLDRCLALWFPAPASFTGEDVVEFHLHGGRAVTAAVLAELGRQPGLRPAEPGEFSRRAFVQGKLDLTAAEGLADLVAAETAAQRRQALAQLGGELGALYERWRERLLRSLAHLEAVIDFADEDLPAGVAEEVAREVARLSDEIGRHLDDANRGERIREGIEIAVVGPPNAGKSTLVNALARREVAIVSPHPGTTRDLIEVPLDLGGYAVVLTDTAGLRDVAAAADAGSAERAIEGEGVRRARQRAEAADLVIAVLDGAVWPETDGETVRLAEMREAVAVVSKCDLGRVPSAPSTTAGRPLLAVAATTGQGLDALRQALTAVIEARFSAGDAPVLSRLRHRQALTEALAALERVGRPDPSAIEEAAEELRLAVGALGRITGRVDVEALLDVIFRDFCIGK